MNYYFIGIGGIGMSALARHFNAIGKNVAGYDRTQSRLTNEIEAEGIAITFEDSINNIPEIFRDKKNTTVVFTPAIPQSNNILRYFIDNGFDIIKRSAMLGKLTDEANAICISGTHGKTTTSTLVAHILRQSNVGCSAFLGGISNNYETNYWSNTESNFIVTEADEYDRSFLQLHPYLSLITAMDADHLDIYGTHKEVVKAFHQFASQTVTGGSLVYKYGLTFDESKVSEDCEIFTYSRCNKEADFYAFNIKLIGSHYHFSISTPFGTIKDVELGVPGMHNVENAVAATALALLAGAEHNEITDALKTFKGNRRRFQYRIETDKICLIDDYAHHPEEIRTMLSSVKEIYKNRRITVVFQPHLYTRTRDFADGFAEALSIADRVILLDIYPARETPIEGVNSQLIANKIKNSDICLTTKDNLYNDITSEPIDVLIMMGAGDIDVLVPEIENKIRKNFIK